MQVSRPRWWLPRGRLVRRLILLFCLASVLPILVAGGVAYGELVRTADRQQERALREEAKSAGMNVLGLLQLVTSAMELPPPAGETTRQIPGGLGQIRYEYVGTAWSASQSELRIPGPAMASLNAGGIVIHPVSGSAESRGLEMLQFQAAAGLLLRANIEPATLAAVVAGEEAALAVRFVNETRPLYDRHGILQTQPNAHWRTSSWVLPLSGQFFAPSLEITMGATRQSAFAEMGLFKIVVPLVLVAAIAMAIWFAVAFLRRQLGPLETLTAATRRIARRELDVRLDIATDDEFGQLAHDFNIMAGNLRNQIRTLESVAEVDRLLLQAPTLANVLEALLPRMAVVMGADRIGVLLPDPQAPELLQVHEFVSGTTAPHAPRSVAMPSGWLQACQDHDDAAMLAVARTVLQTGSTGVSIQRLRHGKSVAGCLCLGWLAAKVPLREDRQMERDLADRLSVALANLSHEQELLRRARFDGLTGLANREFFTETVERHIATLGAGGHNAALLYVDLDGFKKINDSAGHEAGDQVLIEIAARLVRSAGPNNTVARLGGDEFAVLVSASDDPRTPAMVATRILLALQEPVSATGLDRPMSASIGMVRLCEDGDNSETLLRNADIAMYRAKELGRDRIAAFAPIMLNQAKARVDIEIGLRQAVERGELELHYQPIVSAAGLISAEALLRWNWRGHRQVGPAEFIPIAEQSRLIETLGKWSLEQACADLMRWRKSGVAPEYVSINVAPRQLQSEDFLSDILRIVKACGLSPPDLQLEITESAISDGLKAQAMIHSLSEQGFRIAMDDFGTGYSSLSHLHEYPFDVVKVDRSFVASIPGNPMSLRLVDAVIRMAHGLEKRVVAEGVETLDQQAVLLELGCDAMQGFLYGEPVESATFIRRFWDHKRAIAATAGQGQDELRHSA